jgi:hypothetical protein
MDALMSLARLDIATKVDIQSRAAMFSTSGNVLMTIY